MASDRRPPPIPSRRLRDSLSPAKALPPYTSIVAHNYPTVVAPLFCAHQTKFGDTVKLTNMKDSKTIIETLTHSKIYQDYERAFSEATGLPVALRSVESWQLPHHGKRSENPFCALVAQKSRSCAACLQVQQKLSESATHEAQSVTCQLGLCDTAVPVRTGDRLIGFLQTGQVFCRKPTDAQFNRMLKLVTDWGLEVDRSTLREAYFSTRVLNSRQNESVIKLLAIFAQHLSMVSNQVVVQQENAEPPVIARAKQFINEHQTEELSLGDRKSTR